MMKNNTNKIRYIALITVFAALLFGIGAAQLGPDQAVSVAERRKLAQFPQTTLQTVFSGDYSGKLEDYLLDQFPGRDGWRTVKAVLRFDVFRQLDNNGIYLVGDSVYKLEYPLKENQVQAAANKMNEVYDSYLSESAGRVWYSVIPDKSYYTAQQNGYPLLDYDRMLSVLSDTVTRMDYIDIFGALETESYYRTDSHWRQEKLRPVVEALTQRLGTLDSLPAWGSYAVHTLSPFYGVYCGQSALPIGPDGLVYLTSAGTDSATVTSVEQAGTLPVYTLEKFGGMDGYDVFLSGAQALMTIENPNAATDRELILFRDSFGSSLAPLLTDTYAKITLVDLRYVAARHLGEYVDFHGQDVLFLYSASLLNSGLLLK